MTLDNARRALEWIASRWTHTGVPDVAKAALNGEDTTKAIEKAEADIRKSLEPKGPAGLDQAYSDISRGWGDGRGR